MMTEDLLRLMRAEEMEAFERIEPAEKLWQEADAAESETRENLHDIRLRFYRISRAIRVWEGKE